MTVYVDNAEIAFGRMKMSHMIADTVEELHEMAERIGMRSEWFQASPPSSFPHYDVSLSKRREAVRLGAVLMNRREIGEKIRELKKARQLQAIAK